MRTKKIEEIKNINAWVPSCYFYPEIDLSGCYYFNTDLAEEDGYTDLIKIKITIISPKKKVIISKTDIDVALDMFKIKTPIIKDNYKDTPGGFKKYLLDILGLNQ